MLGKLKDVGTNFVGVAKGFFSSSEPSTTYVKDLRKVLTYRDGRKCQYPTNYHEIVNSGEILFDEKTKKYRLSYGEKDKDGKQPEFTLALVKPGLDNISYFTIDFLVSSDRRDVDDYSAYYEPFDFSKIDLEKHIPIFEVDTKSLELTNSSVLGKKGSLLLGKKASKLNDKGEFNEEDRDPEGRNGQLLYTSYYGRPFTKAEMDSDPSTAKDKAEFNAKINTNFSEIRDQNGNLELDKSLISVPIVFAAGLAKVFANWLTYIPMKLGEHLLGKQNPIAKGLGYVLFTPAAIVKNLVNAGATILKAPILLFVANEKKYGDQYYTRWEHQLKECWEKAKSDFTVLKDGQREQEQEEKRPNLPPITATWKELNAMKAKITKDLENQKNSKGASETLSQSKSHSAETVQLTPENGAVEVVKKLKAAVSGVDDKETRTEPSTQATNNDNHADQYLRKKHASPAPYPSK